MERLMFWGGCALMVYIISGCVNHFLAVMPPCNGNFRWLTINWCYDTGTWEWMNEWIPNTVYYTHNCDWTLQYLGCIMEKILSISDGIVGLVQFGFGLSAHIFRFGVSWREICGGSGHMVPVSCSTRMYVSSYSLVQVKDYKWLGVEGLNHHGMAY